MNQQDLFIVQALDAWDSNSKRVSAIFSKLTDEELLQEIAPGKNRVIYLLGHLAAVNDRMLTLMGFADREYAHLDEAFLTNPDKTVAEIPPASELREYWAKSSEILSGHFRKLSTSEWFQRHTSVSEEDFAKEPHRNRLNVLLSRTNHLSFHLGQLSLVKK